MNNLHSKFYAVLDFVLENMFDLIAVGVSAYLVTRHALTPFGPNDIADLATWILALLGLIAISGLWQQHRRLRSIEITSAKTHNLVTSLFEAINSTRKGVMAIQDKYTYDPKFWRSLLEESVYELDLLGHALTAWSEEPYKESFSRHLKNMASSNGIVRIIVMKPGGESQLRIEKATGRSYDRKLDAMLTFMKKEILDQLPPSKRCNIVVRLVSDIDIPYMFIKTERQVLVSPYLARTDSKDNLLMSFDRNSKYANIYINDFERIFACAEDMLWDQFEQSEDKILAKK